MDDYFKTPLAQSLNRLGTAKALDAIQLTGRALPCTVTTVLSSGIVTINFEVNAAPFTLPQITVPIAYSEYIRYPIQVGDKGFVTPADAYLGGITGLGSGTPNLTQPMNLTGLVFVFLGNTAWAAPIDPNAVEIYGVGSSGVILHDGNKEVIVTLTSSGITISTNGNPITINAGGGNVILNGGGNVQVNGGDVIAGSISLMNHVHGGVTTGSSDTGTPVG